MTYTKRIPVTWTGYSPMLVGPEHCDFQLEVYGEKMNDHSLEGRLIISSKDSAVTGEIVIDLMGWVPLAWLEKKVTVDFEFGGSHLPLLNSEVNIIVSAEKSARELTGLDEKPATLKDFGGLFAFEPFPDDELEDED